MSDSIEDKCKAKNIKLGKFKPQGKNPEGQSQIKRKTFTYG